MTLQKIVYCDYCDDCELIEMGQPVTIVKDKGWIFEPIQRAMFHFCSKQCLINFKSKI